MNTNKEKFNHLAYSEWSIPGNCQPPGIINNPDNSKYYAIKTPKRMNVKMIIKGIFRCKLLT